MKLYGMPGSGHIICAYIVAELGIDCETVFPDKATRDSAAFRAISPYGRVPVLAENGMEPVFESLAIVLRLLDLDVDARMAPPKDDTGYGRFLSWMVYLSSTFYHTCLRWHHPEKYGEATSVRQKADEEFDLIYAHIEASPHAWLAGDRMTVADVYLYMVMTWDMGRAKRLLAHPKMARIFNGVASDATVQAVMAHHDKEH